MKRKKIPNKLFKVPSLYALTAKMLFLERPSQGRRADKKAAHVQTTPSKIAMIFGNYYYTGWRENHMAG